LVNAKKMKLTLPSCSLRCFYSGCRGWFYFFVLTAAVVFSAENSFAAEPTATDDSYSARVWRSEDGLPENRVIGVAQAPDGFLWVATQGGLLRFDGVRFQRIGVAGSPSLIAGTMRALILDRTGQIWLAKEEDDTLFSFEGAQMRMLTSEQGLPKNERQYSMATDGYGSLWVRSEFINRWSASHSMAVMRQ
jgi:ligand-binding sensor domain-containing protein